MANQYPRFTYIISRYTHPFSLPSLSPHFLYLTLIPLLRTLDPIFALTIGVAAAGIRIKREENEKRAGLPTTSIVSSSPTTTTIPGSGGKSMVDERVEEMGFLDIVRVGWGRLRGRIMGEEG